MIRSMEETTVLGRPVGRAAPSVDGATGSSSADALRRDEVRRTQRLALVGICLSAGAAMVVPITGGDPLAIWVLLASLGALAIANVYLLAISRRADQYTEGRLAIVWIGGTIGALGACYYFGALSGALAAAMLGIYFVGLGASTRIAVGVYAGFATVQGLMAVLMATGISRDRGLLPASHLPAEVQLTAEALIQGLFLAAHLLARSSRRTTQTAVDDLERAVRAISQREALLLEARQDYARVMRAGDAGRWTDQVLGSYKLGAVIGRGGMGEVYDAIKDSTGTSAAVKVLHAESAAHPGHLERFRREAQAAASLRSSHVVEIYEIGDEAGIPFLAMERLIGTDLSALLRERRRLPLAEVADLLDQLAGGLEVARVAGIVHRDLKPPNVFRTVGSSPIWKILDFGVSKLPDHDGSLTHGHVVGTPQYMAPEQASGAAIDHRADVYALAAIAYRCLTGRPPFAGPDIPALLYQVVHVSPPRPATLITLPDEADDVLMRGLAKQPAERFPTAVELAAAFRAAVGSR